MNSTDCYNIWQKTVTLHI